MPLKPFTKGSFAGPRARFDRKAERAALVATEPLGPFEPLKPLAVAVEGRPFASELLPPFRPGGVRELAERFAEKGSGKLAENGLDLITLGFESDRPSREEPDPDEEEDEEEDEGAPPPIRSRPPPDEPLEVELCELPPPGDLLWRRSKRWDWWPQWPVEGGDQVEAGG